MWFYRHSVSVDMWGPLGPLWVWTLRFLCCLKRSTGHESPTVLGTLLLCREHQDQGDLKTASNRLLVGLVSLWLLWWQAGRHGVGALHSVGVGWENWEREERGAETERWFTWHFNYLPEFVPLASRSGNGLWSHSQAFGHHRGAQSSFAVSQPCQLDPRGAWMKCPSLH